MTPKITEMPVEEISVPQVNVEIPGKADDPTFIASILQELRNDKIWRSTVALVKKFSVTPVQMETLLSGRDDIEKKPGKEEGVTYWALKERLEKKESSENSDKKKLTYPIDREVLGEINIAMEILGHLFDKRAKVLALRSEETLSNLSKCYKLMCIARETFIHDTGIKEKN